MYVVVLVTAPDHETATRLARTLVGERLAACVNIVPNLTSVYRWEGKLCEDAEELLVIKTTAARFEELAARVQQEHPYDVPEVIQLPIQAGSATYLNWLGVETDAGQPPVS